MEINVLFEYMAIPLFMILGGLFMYSNVSGINSFLGYRTSKSMSSQEMWDYAQKTAGKIWIVLGFVELLVLSVLFLQENMFFSQFIIQTIETIILIMTMVMVEVLLRRFEKQKK
jgi:uncharacterized membrane protein